LITTLLGVLLALEVAEVDAEAELVVSMLMAGT
jgi:hypothetical protein